MHHEVQRDTFHVNKQRNPAHKRLSKNQPAERRQFTDAERREYLRKLDEHVKAGGSVKDFYAEHNLFSSLISRWRAQPNLRSPGKKPIERTPVPAVIPQTIVVDGDWGTKLTTIVEDNQKLRRAVSSIIRIASKVGSGLAT